MIPVFGSLIEDAEVCLLPFEVGAENGLAPSDLSALTRGNGISVVVPTGRIFIIVVLMVSCDGNGMLLAGNTYSIWSFDAQ